MMGENTLLVADSSRFYLTMVGQFLSGTGARIVEARTYDQAFSFCREEKPDLIYIDSTLDGRGGIELCQRLKEMPHLDAVPIILMYEEKSAAERGIHPQAPCDGYLTKPLSRRRFLELSRSLLAGLREKRVPCNIKVGFRKGLETTIGKGLDISNGGLFLQSDDPLAVGEQLKLEIQLCQHNEQGPRICCDGTVVWTNDPTAPLKPNLPEGYGTRITVITPKDAALLNGFIKTLDPPTDPT